MCLAVTYEGVKEKVKWRCINKHEWMATSDTVLNGGHWCPQCPFKGESEVRAIFERLTGLRFPSTKSIFEENRRLQLDGYCSKLRIAFERQGEQHYRNVPHFHRNGPIDFEKQQERDAKKRELCEQHWIYLIEVPFDAEPESFIRDALVGLI